MVLEKSEVFEINTPSLDLKATIVSWDTKVFAFPVASINLINIRERNEANKIFDTFTSWTKNQKVKLISCRLPHENILATMFLERHGFHFMEMVLHPTLSIVRSEIERANTLCVEKVLKHEVAIIADMAERAFSFERYHVDPRIDSKAANIRYGCWIKNTIFSDKQTLVKISENHNIIGFFVIEEMPNNKVYWHLTALNPDYIGKGLGTDVWNAMIIYCEELGAKHIMTTISARNTPVLNLYSKLGFRFSPPEITLHWFGETN